MTGLGSYRSVGSPVDQASGRSSFGNHHYPHKSLPCAVPHATTAEIMSQPDGSRLTLELELLEAMYPGQIDYDAKSRDMKFAVSSALLQLRLPDGYPDAGLPDVISATDAAKNDLRDRMKAALEALALTEGDEALDAVVACFQDIVEANSSIDLQPGTAVPSSLPAAAEGSKTVVVWLHHLLALSKRKLALKPTSLSGVTKPGYPGVMVFSGPAVAIAEHVNTLKAENWQAFQVRYEGDERWTFAHGAKI